MATSFGLTAFPAGANPARTFGTPVTNGSRRRIVMVSADVTSAVGGVAYIGFVTTVGGTAITIADYSGLPMSNPGRTYRAFMVFPVDPGASYTITTDVGTGASSTLVNVVEVDL